VRELMLPKDSFAILDLRMVEALPGMRYPFVYNAHNAEHSLFSRRADHERQPVRSLIRLESARIRRIEAKAVLNARLIAACSDNDRRELVDLAPQSDSKVVVMPNGVDTRRYSPIADAACEPRTILLSGSYHWRPNLIGLEWFLAEVLPLLRARMPGGGYAIRVAGRMKPDVVERLRRYPDVTAVPDPPDMRDELERAAIVAAPVLVSSGTRLRILEAWAAGRPVVTTSPGALGLTCRDGQELLLADTPVEFAHAICRLLDDAALWRHIHDVALVHARAYDWMRLGAEFLDRAAPLLG
jgi:glycosyltransferase involved in cell wall biosynthesis